MKLTYLDTLKMQEISNDIINLANEYQLEITNLFKRINDMPFTTKEWVGHQAEKYVKIIALDKNEFIDFGERIKEYANKIKKHTAELEDTIKKNNLEESSKV